MENSIIQFWLLQLLFALVFYRHEMEVWNEELMDVRVNFQLAPSRNREGKGQFRRLILGAIIYLYNGQCT